MQVIFGILLISMGAATSSLIWDPVVCTLNKNDQCYVALGQRMYLQIPLKEEDRLRFTFTTNNHLILSYSKQQINQPPNPPRWQFVKDNNTMILTSAERSDSGTYTLEIYDVNGKFKGKYTLRIITEGKCVVGDNLRFNWTYPSFIQLENGDSTLVLDKIPKTSHVVLEITSAIATIPSSSTNYTLIILSTVCALLIVIAVVAFYMYRRRLSLRNKEARSQETIPRTSPAQDKKVEYAVVARPKESKQKGNQNELQYGELVFNNPATNKSETPKVQEDCVYSQVQYGQ